MNNAIKNALTRQRDDLVEMVAIMKCRIAVNERLSPGEQTIDVEAERLWVRELERLIQLMDATLTCRCPALSLRLGSLARRLRREYAERHSTSGQVSE